MRTSITGAALLLAGAGAAGFAAAADTNGSGIALNGSDTLADVTNNDVFSACSAQFGDWTTNPITYQGGGSRVGAGNMDQSLQAVSPMSSALKNTEFCTNAASVYTAPAVSASAGLTAGLLVGLDGVAISANQINSCSSSVANGIGGATVAVTNDGTGTPATNPPASCPGCVAGSYTFGDATQTKFANQASFDALAVLYFGFTHDGTYSGCGSPVRKSLIKNWKNLFSSDCAAGDATCSAGLTHAWRRSDLSGTTDAFVSIINPPAGTVANGKGASVAVGIGSLPSLIAAGVTGAAAKSNPFCNSLDANTNPAPITPGGSSDFSDADPVRTNCVPGVDTVCEGFKLQTTTGGNFAGDLGVVLPVLIPDAAATHPVDLYPQTACTAACVPVPAFKTSQAGKYPGFLCPNGLPPTGGNFCFMPFAGSASSPNPQCVASNQTKCVDVVGGKPDGRRYNLVTVVPSTQIPSAFRTGTFQFSVDATSPVPRILNGSFHRIHSVVPGANYAASIGAETGTTGICQQGDDTSQIGCLTDSDPCSIGYAGRESAQGFPGLAQTVNGVTTLNPTSQPLKGLAVNGTPPFTPGADPDLAIKNLLAASGTTPLYPLSRRLYFATIYGFGNLQGHEKELAQCYGTNSIVSSAMSNNGFVPAPTGVSCLDYPQTQGTGTPAPNAQGSGNVALGGCATAPGSNTDACTGAGQLTDINGNPVPEATETF
jgi:ABC-type phosphate transport system substrate-binding protein